MVELERLVRLDFDLIDEERPLFFEFLEVVGLLELFELDLYVLEVGLLKLLLDREVDDFGLLKLLFRETVEPTGLEKLLGFGFD